MDLEVIKMVNSAWVAIYNLQNFSLYSCELLLYDYGLIIRR